MCRADQETKREGVEDKLGRATTMLREIKELRDTIREEDHPLVLRRVGQVVAELADIRDMLVAMVRSRLSPRQLSVLEEEVVEDPSVQFFGVEWDTVFGRCFNLGLNIRIFKARLENDVVDSLGLAGILADLRRVEQEVEQHSVAILSGRLSADQLGRQLEQQLRVSRVGELARSQHQLQTKGRDEGARAVKYKKNKTENLANKISRSQKERRGSTVEVVERKKKNSFVQKMSDMLIEYI
jgi:hypothetical protein